MNLKLRLAIEWVIISLVATTVIIAFAHWHGPASFDNVVYDRLSSLAPAKADEGILIVAIDDPSIVELGKWPWQRSVHARLIERLQSARPRSITLDLILSESANRSTDSALAKSISGPSPVFLPLHFSSPGSNGRAFDTHLPTPILALAAKGIGHVNLDFGHDGIVRHAALCFQSEKSGQAWPHIMELVYRLDNTAPSPAYTQSGRCGSELLIPFARRGTFTEISYAEILNSNVPDEFISGRDVIIGATAAGLGDNFPVPNGNRGLLSGVEIMANMLGAMRRDDFIRPLGMQWVVALSLFPTWLLLIGFLRWRPRAVLAMSIMMIVMILLVSVGLLRSRIWFPPGTALLGVLLIYPLWGWRRLQAMSDFMGSKLGALENEGEVIPLPVTPNPTTDLVGRQSEALAGAIDRMRDLRRFVSDTLADLPDPMFVTDPWGKVTLTNRKLDECLNRKISGMTMSEALDQMVVREHRDQVDRYIESREHTEPGPTNLDAELVRFVSPLARVFVMRRSAVRSDSGILRGHIHYLTDITALAQAEAEREEVLQLLSHDMRAPQSTIIALLEGEIDAEAKKRIASNARRTMKLAQDFVEMARMAETDFDSQEVLLADLVRETADDFWPLAKERKIEIVVIDNSNFAFVSAEPDTLSRAFANLLDNAIKFSPDGGEIQIAVEEDGQLCSVTICDQGPGLDSDSLPLLFQRFTTGSGQKGRAKGIGLGLTFVHAVITRHGGTVVARNSAEAGACFSVSLHKTSDEMDAQSLPLRETE